MRAGWDGWALSDTNESRLIQEEYYLDDVVTGKAGAEETLKAFRDLMKATNNDLEAQLSFDLKHSGYRQRVDGSWELPA